MAMNLHDSESHATVCEVSQALDSPYADKLLGFITEVGALDVCCFQRWRATLRSILVSRDA